MIEKHELGNDIPHNTGVIILKVENLIDQQKIESILERINNLSDSELVRRLDVVDESKVIIELKEEIENLGDEIDELKSTQLDEDDFPEAALYNDLRSAVI